MRVASTNASAVLLLALALLAAACQPRAPTAGERIFLAAQGAEGPVTFRTGPSWMAHGRFGCATCHGKDGQGLTVEVRGIVGAAPPIDRETLVRRGYDRAALRRAIEDGVDPAGRPLNRYMPRWEIGDDDFARLADHLERL